MGYFTYSLTVQTMEIRFEGPHYYCDADEAGFFELMYSLPEYIEVIGMGRELVLKLEDPVSYESSIQLLTMFHRWGIDKDVLTPLKTKENENNDLWNKSVKYV